MADTLSAGIVKQFPDGSARRRGGYARSRVQAAGRAGRARRAGARRRSIEESREWLRSLRAEGPARGTRRSRGCTRCCSARPRFEVARRRPALPHLRGDDLDDIANQAADDALISVLRRLDDFRGASRFTTWVYKFALLEAAVKLRKRAWQGRELPLEPEAWSLVRRAAGPARTRRSSRASCSRRCSRRSATMLTPHQREVLVALALNGVPIDVLAERLGTTRGALYKTLHDARQKLREHLAERGLSPDPDWRKRD